MEFTTFAAALVLANIHNPPEIIKQDTSLPCFIIQNPKIETKTRLVCNFNKNEIDDKTKQFIQDYMKENNIEEIYSIEATWTEGLE